MAGYRLGNPHYRISTEEKGFSLHQNDQTDSEVHRESLSVGTGDVLEG